MRNEPSLPKAWADKDYASQPYLQALRNGRADASLAPFAQSARAPRIPRQSLTSPLPPGAVIRFLEQLQREHKAGRHASAEALQSAVSDFINTLPWPLREGALRTSLLWAQDNSPGPVMVQAICKALSEHLNKVLGIIESARSSGPDHHERDMAA